MIVEALANFDVSSLPGADDIFRKKLSNNVTVLIRENNTSPSISIKGYLKSGSIYDADDKLGLSLFTALSLMRGTTQRSFQEIYNTLESAGASLGFSSAVHSVAFGGKALSEDLPTLLEILSNCLKQPIFPIEQIERLRAQWLTRLAIRSQDTNEMASLRFDELLFPDHPYGRPEEGFLETINNINQDDLISFHDKYYGPESFVIVISGGIKTQNTFELIQKYFGDWHKVTGEDNPLEYEVKNWIKRSGSIFPFRGRVSPVYLLVH